MLDVVADDPQDAGIWSDSTALLAGWGADDGIVDGGAVKGITPTRLHFPFAGMFANEDNPILTWKATWRPSILLPREVPIVTDTYEFAVFATAEGDWKDLTDSAAEGHGAILVVPAPPVGVTSLIAAAGQLVPRQRGVRWEPC